MTFYTAMGGLDAAKLDRWITREPDYDDDPEGDECCQCGEPYEGPRQWPGIWLCESCAAAVAAAEAEAERLFDEAEEALDAQMRARGCDEWSDQGALRNDGDGNCAEVQS